MSRIGKIRKQRLDRLSGVEEEIQEKIKIRCECCEGTGKAYDPKKTGKVLSSLRGSYSITAAEIAKRMGVSRQFLCNYENGNRNWNSEIVNRYISTVIDVVKEAR